MKKLVIGIFAHVDAGKTTLAESMLHLAGLLRKIGRVDHGNSYLDTDPMERNRGITIFSSQARFQWENADFTILDTPGHADFIAEAERTIPVLDGAVLLISANDGVQAHTVTLWNLLKEYEVPTAVFVNKMDLSVRKKPEVMDILKKRLSSRVIDFSEEFSEAFLDDVTLASPELLETVLSGKEPEDSEIAHAVGKRDIFPCWFGSALREEGTDALLSGMGRFFPDPEEGRIDPKDESLAAYCYKIGREERGERLAFLRVTSGILHVKERVPFEDGEEKINQIRMYSGNRYALRKEAVRGEIAAVTGLSKIRSGGSIGREEKRRKEIEEPYLQYSVHVENASDQELYTALADLGEEASELSVRWDPERSECVIHGMGDVQLEVLTDLLRKRYGMEISFGDPAVLYRETITRTAEGAAHFEPLRHYAEVHLILEPGERGSGLFFDTSAREDDLDRNWQRLILTHLQECVHPGVLTGAPITDMKITLASGKASKKHTSGGDFREAVYRAVRAGLMQGESVLLEPWLSFRANVPVASTGRLMTDIRRMGGEFGEPELAGGKSVLTGRVPALELMGYGQELRNYTKGQGTLESWISGYDLCHNQEEVIRESGYDPLRDTDHLPDSVFTEKGSSVIVPWKEAYERMDLPSALSEKNAEEGRVDPDALRRRAESYREKLVTDKELKEIFERTYGKTDPRRRNVRKTGRSSEAAEEQKLRESRSRNGKRRNLSDQEAPEILLVDGYNVIYDWDELRELSSDDYGAARARLVEILCNYAGISGEEVKVIFDAYKVKGGQGMKDRIHNVDVVFTGEKETADSYIERLSGVIPKNRRVRVVSSDAQIQQIALGHGALRTSSREFLEEVKDLEDRVREACISRD